MSTETYLERLEQEHAAETNAVRELQEFWRSAYPFMQWRCLPEEKRFRFWVRTYGLRLMKHALTITKDNCKSSWTVTRLGKYASAVARNIHEESKAAAPRTVTPCNAGPV